MDRLDVLLEKLRTGLWPIPLLMSLVAVALYNVALGIDRTGLDENVLRQWYLHGGTGDDARNLLSTLVTAIITMSSVVFSITIVVLSNAANQFGTRLIRTYMADLRTKLTLGLLAMTITYCLVALRAVQHDMPAAQVPHVVVSAAWLLGLCCVLVLLFFLHFVSRSIVADQIIARAAAELTHHIETLEPIGEDDDGERREQSELPEDFDTSHHVLRSTGEGYVEAVRYEALLALAAKHRIHVRMEARAGTYMCKDGWLARIYPRNAISEELAASINEQVLIGQQRTPTQDVEFMLRHLVDIALRALSPGINDENTCLVVIDHLGGALSKLAGRRIASHRYRDEDGVLRVLGKGNDYGGVLGAALNQIRQAAASHPAVIIEVIRALSKIGEHHRDLGQLNALMEQARLFRNAGLRGTEEAYDRDAIERAFADTEHKLMAFKVNSC
jgi:uncharacterized membrane protein